MTGNYRLRRSKIPWSLCGLALVLIAATTPTPIPTSTPIPEGKATNVEPPPWGEPVLLSALGQSSWFPDVFADAAGNVHAVWSTLVSTGPGKAFDAVIYRSSQDGKTWTDRIDVAASPTKGAVTRASILVDTDGFLHFTYRSYTIYYSHLPVNAIRASNVLPAREISKPDSGYFSRMSMDSQGRIHLVYSENIYDPNCTGCFHLFYRWSDDKGRTWAEPVDVSRIPTGAAKPWLLIDKQDNLHLVWETGRGGDLGQVPEPARVAYAASYDRGENWSQPFDLVPAPDGQGRHVTIGIDGQGTLVVAWLALPEDRSYYRTSTDGGRTWSEPQVIPGVWGMWELYQSKLDTYSMAADSAGNLHLVLVGRNSSTQKSLSVLELVWNGEGWSRPGVATTLTGDVPEWPRISIGQGNQLHVTWFVRYKAAIFDSNKAEYTAWYIRGQADAPSVPSIVFPAAVSDPAAPAALASTSTPSEPTATPIHLDLPPGQPIKVYTEANYLALAVQSLIPVVVLIGVVLVFAIRMRRRR